MNYAIIDIVGNQYVVSPGDTILVNKIDSPIKTELKSDKVLLIVDEEKVNIGNPYIKNANVTYQIIKHSRGEKIDVFKYKAKSRYRKNRGFRAELTSVKIVKIETKKEK